MENIMIKIDGVKKQYKLGQIGGTTLRDELQRLNAKIHHKEDPTRRIGAKDYNKGETFMALDGISFEVKRGERVGIIGHNGAGKSTLLKLLSRVTAPTDGTIGLNGRVASMLEVGTGFHPELTGRENIYMNGAILGMTKKEIDAKIEDIIDFSECRQFIDTPVKRYSSGMYVKLAFSVAAHLNSEILIMDEVLAVGDMAFQKKCLDKMNDVSRQDGRTILYVSHNMNTIRQLCDRVIVLDHGKVVFDGDVEEGIEAYMGINDVDVFPCKYDFKNGKRLYHFGTYAFIESLEFVGKNSADYNIGESAMIEVKFRSEVTIPSARLLLHIRDNSYVKIGAAMTERFEAFPGVHTIQFILATDKLCSGKYCLNVELISVDEQYAFVSYDNPGAKIIMNLNNEFAHGIKWENKYWGNVCFDTLKIEGIDHEDLHPDVSQCT